MQSLKDLLKKSKAKIQETMEEKGVNKKIDQLKDEMNVLKDAVTISAEEVYQENKEFLEKPVSVISDTIDKIKPYKEHIQYLGIVVMGIAMPVTTLVVSSVFYLCSKDDDELTEEERKEKEELMKELKKDSKDIPEILTYDNQAIFAQVNLKERKVSGHIKLGKFKDQTFENVGTSKIQELALNLPESLTEQEMDETKKILLQWVKDQK